MNRTRPGKEFVLVAWKDSDVQDIIKDKSFAGKLMDKGCRHRRLTGRFKIF